MTDKELLKTVTAFRSGLLGKRRPIYMCYAVCAPLRCFLLMCGIETQLIEKRYDNNTYNHFWLELSDGRIIDPTASQFNNPITGEPLPKVYIGDKPEFYDTGFL